MANNTFPIHSITINEFPQPNGENFLNFSVVFNSWFTIIAGENGTGKSTVLKRIKEKLGENAILYNPKRNSARKQLVQAIDDVEKGNRRKINLLQELNRGFDDNTFHPYSSFPETIAAEYREKMGKTQGKTPPEKIINDLEAEYGNLVTEVFPTYQAINWKFKNHGPYFKIKKFDKYLFETNELSTGEQEILSLVTSVKSAQESANVILIDEPEIHLNYSLEEKLFNFLKTLALENKKQIIVTTHSRVILNKKFKGNCIYLYFDKKRVKVEDSIPVKILTNIVGEFAKYFLAEPKLKTVLVEDDFHIDTLKVLKSLLNNKNVKNIFPLKGKNTVKKLYNNISSQRSYGVFKNTYFLVDGDNNPDPHPDDEKFINLSKGYSIEAYFLNIEVLSKISKISKAKIKKKITEILNTLRKKQVDKDGNMLAAGKLKERDINLAKLKNYKNCKNLFPDLYKFLRFKNRVEFLTEYISYLIKDKRRLKIFDKKLLNLFKE